MCKVDVSSLFLLAVVAPNIIEILLYIAISFFLIELFPSSQYFFCKLFSSLFAQNFFILDRFARFVPSLFSIFVIDKFNVPLVILRNGVTVHMIVGGHEALVVEFPSIGQILNKVREFLLLDKVVRNIEAITCYSLGSDALLIICDNFWRGFWSSCFWFYHYFNFRLNNQGFLFLATLDCYRLNLVLTIT